MDSIIKTYCSIYNQGHINKNKNQKIQISTIMSLHLRLSFTRRSSTLQIIKSNAPRSIQIFSNFSALTRGFSLAIASLPAALKSKAQPCCSGYLWVPQNVVPHLHVKPISPTLFRHAEHRFGLTTCSATVSIVQTNRSREVSGKDTADDDGTTTAGAGEGNREFSTADLADFSCSAFMDMSR